MVLYLFQIFFRGNLEFNYMAIFSFLGNCLMCVKGKVDFPQIGFEKGTTERGVSKVSKSC